MLQTLILKTDLTILDIFASILVLLFSSFELISIFHGLHHSFLKSTKVHMYIFYY